MAPNHHGHTYTHEEWVRDEKEKKEAQSRRHSWGCGDVCMIFLLLFLIWILYVSAVDFHAKFKKAMLEYA